MIEPSLILIGAGGHARSCIDVIEQQGEYQIAGMIGMPDESLAKKQPILQLKQRMTPFDMSMMRLDIIFVFQISKLLWVWLN